MRKSYEVNGVCLETALVSVAPNGRAQYMYVLYAEGIEMLRGGDYCPPIALKPVGGWADKLEGRSLGLLLEFLVRTPDEVDEGYFRAYSDQALQWLRTEQFRKFKNAVEEGRHESN